MSPAAKLSWASPTGTTHLIRKAGLLEHVLKQFSTWYHSSWGAKTSQMGVTSPALPKYEISHPKSPLIWATVSATTWLPHLVLLIYYLLAPPAAPPHLATLPSHPAPSAYYPSYLLTQKTLLLIQMNPGTHSSMVVFDFFWVIEFVLYAFMKWLE